jgi:hypothetical protein
MVRMKPWIAVLASTAALQVWGADMSIFRGEGLEEAGIKISPLGSGKITANPTAAKVGKNSLQIKSSNLFQGGTLSLKQPVDLTTAAADANNVLLFSIQPLDTVSGGGGSDPNRKHMKYLRVVLTTDDSKRTELLIPVLIRSAGAWLNLGVPMKAFPGFEATSKRVKSFTFAADSPDEFLLGEIQVMNDTTPITAEAFVNDSATDLTVANNDTVLLWAVAEAGSSVLEYAWDIDSADGFQDEQQGPTVEHMFRKPGTYTITVRVSDKYGLKKSVMATVKVKVSQ